jgi:hypothetical protein
MAVTPAVIDWRRTEHVFPFDDRERARCVLASETAAEYAADELQSGVFGRLSMADGREP